MTAGQMRERVTFQRQTGGSDIYGNVVTGWADHLTVWADIRETLGKERVDAGRIEASATATVRIRASNATRALTEADRMIGRGVTWNIRSIVEVGNNRAMLDVLCEKGVAS
jgi:SPP1 family predicted phage head-tail adaptor